MKFLDYIKQGDVVKATTLIETVLKQKTLFHIKEHRSVVAEDTYSGKLDEKLNDTQFADYASKQAWKATVKARNTQKYDDHFRAGRLHTAAAKLHSGAKGKDHQGQAGVHYSLAARAKKHPEEVQEGEYNDNSQ